MTKQKAAPGVATGETHRQTIATGTITDVCAIQPAIPEHEAYDLDTAKHHAQYTDQHVESSAAFVLRSGITQFMVDHYAADRWFRGRTTKAGETIYALDP